MTKRHLHLVKGVTALEDPDISVRPHSVRVKCIEQRKLGYCGTGRERFMSLEILEVIASKSKSQGNNIQMWWGMQLAPSEINECQWRERGMMS